MPEPGSGPAGSRRWVRVGLPLALLAGLAAWITLARVPDEASAPAAVAGEPPVIGDRRGALVDQVVFTQEGDPGKVAELIESGSHQLFAQGVSNATVFRRIRDSQKIAYSEAYGSSSELTVNPAGPRFTDGRINPFAVPELREALNWLVDRRYIAEELYGGLAVPRTLPLNSGFPDYARLAEVARTLELRYAHDPERAHKVIDAEMSKLGATREAGIWTHDGKPVRLSVLIRTDDERRRVGDYVANLLEAEGFDVERMYRAADEASRIWIAGDPKQGRWHLYTGGFVSTLIQRDISDSFAYFYTALGRPEPLWQAYEPVPEFLTIAERLQRADYASYAERQQLMSRGLELAMQNSVHIWLVDVINVLPRAANVALTSDLAGGVSGSWLWAYTLRYTDRIGGSVVVGLPALLAEPWNPVAGSNWMFDRMIMRGLTDSPVLPDPYTGLFWPQEVVRADVVVQGDLPVTRTLDWVTLERVPEIPVPPDAWIDWNGAAQQWVTVGDRYPDGVTTRAKVTVEFVPDFFERHWHDGTQVSPADLLVALIFPFERADPASPLYDPSYELVFDVYRQHFRGMRIIARAPLTVEIYSDEVLLDAEFMVANRVPTVVPWHTLAIGMLADRQGELAFSSGKADQEKVDWMSYVAGPSLPILKRHLDEATVDGFVPYASVVTAELRDGEVAERYRSLGTWYAEHKHFWVDNGPLYLHSVHPVERNVVLRRFEDYPDRSDKWLRFTAPRIPVLDLEGPMIVRTGESPKFDLCVSDRGEPYPDADIDRARYLLFDGRGQLRAQGDAVPDGAGDGCWSVQLGADQVAGLGTGANSLEFAVTSIDVTLPAFATHAFATVPE
jgi:peptide/nickel transport system substrate-binding protein